ncbi:stomatin-like protein 1 [Nematolebias whitei]|uniref:stomatin-like protein 1 n=1 Tax=Nematolebias whitei TaxID=451745 RepID=UPI00189ACE25|nr:stomatin-like protein 1 [Nematolebias whitei]
MFSRSSYELLPQRDSSSQRTPGLFVNSHKGLSFDYIPNVSANDFTDTTQGWLSWICNLVVIFLVYICTFIMLPITGWFVLKTVPNYQRIVVFRLGRVCPPKGPGVVLVLPLIDQWQKVDLRTRAFNIPPSQVTTRDGGVLLVGADIQFRIWNPVMSVVLVQDLNASTRMTAQNALTHSLSKKTIREIQTERVKLGEYLGTLVQLGLYAMGRDSKVFFQPKQYQPSRWLRTGTQYFKSLGFGFGPRQCLGRRIAEAEMQIFLIHMLENFRVEKHHNVEARSTFELILLPDKPILLTLKPLQAN